MLWKIIIAVSAVSIIAGGVVWIKDGMVLLPHDRERVVTVKKDELFGTTTEEITWKAVEPAYGLLPPTDTVSAIPNSFAFVLGSGIALIIGSMIMLRRTSPSTRS
jgi:hypothetical protein